MKNINNSSDVNSSRYVYSSRNVDSSSDVDSSRYVYSSRNVDSSRIVYSSRAVVSSYSVYSSRYVVLSCYVIFCYDIKCKEYYAFNKQVTKDRFYEIINLWNKLKGDFKLELENNLWTDEWKKLPNSVWQELAKLPEWDINVVEKITGFKPNIEISKEMTVAEISEKLGYEVKVIK